MSTYLVQHRKTEEIAERIKTALGGLVADVVLECTGVESPLAAAIFTVRFGGTVFVVSVGKNEIKFPFMRLSRREIDLKFQYRYANTRPKAIRLVDSGVLVGIRKLVTHRFPFEDAAKAFETSADVKTGATYQGSDYEPSRSYDTELLFCFGIVVCLFQ